MLFLVKKFQKENNYSLLLFFTCLLFLLPHCAKEDKKIEDMSFDEIKKKTLSAIENKKDDIAIECLERLIAQYPDNQNIAKHKLMLADLYFNTGNLPSAHQLYNHYAQFYPSDPKAEYATYKALLAKFYQTLKVDCDQSYTDKTIQLCKDYLNNPTFKEYKNDVIDVQNTCEQRLIDKEVYVYNYYLKQEKYEAAKKRLAYLRNNYVAKNPALEARLLFLEAKLLKKQNDNKKANEKIEQLVSKHPDSHFTKMALRLNKKTTFVF